ncbi:hypothetical protein M438DRAFT_348186 [Aureobasidium pullulans EXF-150]|uniref:Uncharacterized protein n=1 Tax=Aureobasidium pullulans EXF-150 TaxID=1043002 RepID=A0A074X7N9_AURPU|nr:uncharacterized protein M438DRAFT_348186 [Aureobasidium pullulans EXF-150]KEQ81408.1 hypothetical protein M438DRAFT_348186 [Aureobasidium pullulans EXF-150]
MISQIFQTQLSHPQSPEPTTTMNAYRRGNWTPQEDDLMLKLLATHAPCDWNRISDLMQTRSPKQCSERWTQHLRQDLDHSAFTRYECWAIQNLVAQYGTSWALIAQHLPHRSERKIKNWWYNLQQRQKRKLKREEGELKAVRRLHAFAFNREPSPAVAEASLQPSDTFVIPTTTMSPISLRISSQQADSPGVYSPLATEYTLDVATKTLEPARTSQNPNIGLPSPISPPKHHFQRQTPQHQEESSTKTDTRLPSPKPHPLDQYRQWIAEYQQEILRIHHHHSFVSPVEQQKRVLEWQKSVNDGMAQPEALAEVQLRCLRATVRSAWTRS